MAGMASRTKTQDLLAWQPRFPRRPITRRFKPITMTPRPTPYADWYCEGDAIGHPSVCSPGNPIHSPAHCGWMS